MIKQKTRVIRVPDEDWERVRRLAKASGRSMSAYIRSLLNLEVPRPIPPEEYRQLQRELSAIGNNINQMARLSHELGNVDYSKFHDALKTIYDVQKRLAKQQQPVSLKEKSHGNS